MGNGLLLGKINHNDLTSYISVTSNIYSTCVSEQQESNSLIYYKWLKYTIIESLYFLCTLSQSFKSVWQCLCFTPKMEDSAQKTLVLSKCSSIHVKQHFQFGHFTSALIVSQIWNMDGSSVVTKATWLTWVKHCYFSGTSRFK